MASFVSTSDTVIGGLCREVDGIRQRCQQLSASMRHCQDTGLFARLRQEQQRLQRRRIELLDAARSWQQRGAMDPLAIDFLIEISSRPLLG
jgi:hypothetical protein